MDVIVAGEIVIRPSEHLALVRGRALCLSQRELDVLCELARHQGRIVSREDLYASVWGGAMRPTDRSVDVYVHRLRTKLATALPGWDCIHTHFGFGYRLAPELSQPVHKTAALTPQAVPQTWKGTP